MSNQFKPGDLALIVGAHMTPDNVGKVCELVEFLAQEQISTWREPHHGMVIQNGDVHAAWVVIGAGLASCFGLSGWALVDQTHLMPLRDDSVRENQKSKEAESA
ncbi:hypothetical protein FOM00_11935 [Pseudomonas sp. ST1]|uniref:hypothetical protein n=1 Tax=Pseudomonas TaxID=286 RepID=UPI00040437EB|nr:MULTISPECIES: hypothetical protein [Pseudomonas]KAA3536640.1 hypothetical protein DXU85_23185 [Pseudomonas savastanoi]RML75914.1 hypothetical protein ALQ90_03125 [Pseudomonas savastanoi pv. savastanoi]TSC36749.1 hypothetical protein FOM00_11935 [Pseudomonas sp. ST1]UKL12341.1 hypothetical protein HQ966_13725 [Pseudomonas savastanoi pv. savastanoi]